MVAPRLRAEHVELPEPREVLGIGGRRGGRDEIARDPQRARQTNGHPPDTLTTGIAVEHSRPPLESRGGNQHAGMQKTP